MIDDIELKTGPTRHCFTHYIEFHRCLAAKGEESSECQRFAKYYRSLCLGEWLQNWKMNMTHLYFKWNLIIV
ncbi:hypothetical protein CsSME_00026744 [Camellia sinensis var. sinensis]